MAYGDSAMEDLAMTDYWRNKRVFITGHTGFKGAWLTMWLENLGAKVWGYALPPDSDNSLFIKAGVEENMAGSTYADVRDLRRLKCAMLEAAPEIVIHMAAQALVRPSYRDPVSTYETNVIGTVNLLESVRQHPSVKAVVVVTTDKCYENREWHWGYRESDPLGGYDPYSSSKSCAELVTAAYRNSFFGSGSGQHPAAIASARAGNVIGGGDWSTDRLLPDVFRAASSQSVLRIRNPNAIRPWQHVLEPLRGYLILAQHLDQARYQYSSSYNFGPRDDDARSVGEVVSEICHLWGDIIEVEHEVEKQPHEASYLKLDISKARNELNWQPALSLRESLSLTVDWMKHYLNTGDARTITFTQIHKYSNDLRVN